MYKHRIDRAGPSPKQMKHLLLASNIISTKPATFSKIYLQSSG